MAVIDTNKKKSAKDILDKIHQLEEEMEYIKEKEEQLERFQTYVDLGKKFKLIVDAFEEAGFTNDQAFELFISTLETSSYMLK